MLAANTPTQTLYFHLDHLGTPRVVSTSGAPGRYDSRTYYPFGEDVADATAGAGDFLRFTGHESDVLSFERNTLDYMHARFYNPIPGRFLSPDLVLGNLLRPGSWNRYAYVLNNPIDFVDPYGLLPVGGGGGNRVDADCQPGEEVPPGGCHSEVGLDYGSSFDVNFIYHSRLLASQFFGAVQRSVDSRDVSNFVGGFGNGVSLGLTGWVQDQWDTALWDDVPTLDRDSLAYDTGIKWSYVIQIAIQLEGARTGYEFKFGKNVRIAPWGNRKGDPLGKYPHYHRRIVGPNGKTIPGGAVGRHRPWQAPPAGLPWWMRF